MLFNPTFIFGQMNAAALWRALAMRATKIVHAEA